MPKPNRVDKSRDGGSFVAITKDVLDSKAFISLSYSSSKLLMTILAQSTQNNNGKLVACSKYLKPRGWSSNATVSKALSELLESGLLVMTRRGHKPNKASWFGVAWYALGRKVDERLLDITGREFEVARHQWKSKERLGSQIVRPPINGVGSQVITPNNDVSVIQPAPKNSAIQAEFQASLHQ